MKPLSFVKRGHWIYMDSLYRKRLKSSMKESGERERGGSYRQEEG